MKFDGKGYNELSIGDAFTEKVTVSAEMITLCARLIGDFNPLHVSDEFARASRYGQRILHGVMTAAIAGAPIGNIFAGTGIAYLEQNNRFTAPVYAGDTLASTWTVTEKTDKPRSNGGIVALECTCRNQNDIVVLQATGKVLAANK
jgi:3-hydroxybutyryl-CoA dehydratase